MPERGEGQGWWSFMLTAHGIGLFRDSRALEDTMVSLLLTRNLYPHDGCASRGFKDWQLT